MIKAGKAGKFKWNPKGYRAVMTSPGVEADLERRSEAAARAANQQAGLPDGFKGGVLRHKSKSAAYVTAAAPSARRRQAESDLLQSAIDAMRG